MFRDLQVSSFLDACDTQLDTEQYELVFSSIQLTPVRAFERDQQNRILRSLLRALLWNKLPTSTTIIDHISLLAEYLSVSNNSISLLTKRQEQAKALARDESPPLISLALKLDRNGGLAIGIPATVAFRRLVRLTFRYVTIVSPASNRY